MKLTTFRFRLSTLLLIIVVIGLSAGWFVDRRINLQRQIDQIEREWYGLASFHESWKTILTARAYRDKDSVEFQNYLRYELYWSISIAWRNQKEIGLSGEDEYSSLNLANEAMSILECDSSSDFIEFAYDLFPDSNHGIFPEIYDASSSDYKSLQDFLRTALEPQNAIAWGQ